MTVCRRAVFVNESAAQAPFCNELWVASAQHTAPKAVRVEWILAGSLCFGRAQAEFTFAANDKRTFFCHKAC